MKIKKAILPVAGFGTRILPATKAQPKEMLPVVDKPAIQYLVEEAAAAGIEEIVFVTGRGKRAIEDHFDYSFELDHTLVEKNKTDLIKKVRNIEKLAKFSYVRQPIPLGDGHAVLCARHLVGNNPVLVMFGDSLYDSPVPAAKQLLDAYEKYEGTFIGLAEARLEQIEQFGVIDGEEKENGIYRVKKIIEKPRRSEAPSNLVAAGKYIVTPEIFEILENMEKGKSGEIRLADAFDVALKQGKSIYGKRLKGEWLDTGNKFNYLIAIIKLGLKHPEIGADLRDFLKNLDL